MSICAESAAPLMGTEAMDEVTRRFAERYPRDFGFLVDECGCTTPSIDERTWWAMHVTYRNTTTAVRVSLNREFRCVELNLAELRSVEAPDNDYEDSRWWVSLNEVLAARSAPVERLHLPVDLTPTAVEEALTRHAEALRRYADDVLRGDFGIFVHVRQRRAQARERAIRRRRALDKWLHATLAGLLGAYGFVRRGGDYVRRLEDLWWILRGQLNDESPSDGPTVIRAYFESTVFVPGLAAVLGGRAGPDPELPSLLDGNFRQVSLDRWDLEAAHGSAAGRDQLRAHVAELLERRVLPKLQPYRDRRQIVVHLTTLQRRRGGRGSPYPPTQLAVYLDAMHKLLGHEAEIEGAPRRSGRDALE